MSTGREADYDWAGNVPAKVKDLWLSTILSSKFRINTAQMRLHMGYTEAPSPNPDLFDWSVRGGFTLGYDLYITLRASDDVSFFGDEVMHTLGHAIFTLDEIGGGIDGTWSECFTLKANGRPGTHADWVIGYTGEQYVNSTFEAMAEFFKDVYRAPRKNNNRTNWVFDQSHFRKFQQYMSRVTCPPQPG